MKQCQKCDLDFPDSFRFCGSCGGALPQRFTCAYCGEVVEARWAFCTSCGKSFSANSSDSRSEPSIVAASPSMVTQASRSPASQPTAMAGQPAEPSKQVATQEWYAAPDLFDEDNETTLTAPALYPTREVSAKVAMGPSAIAPPAQNGNGKAPPTLTMLSAYGETEPVIASRSEGKRGLIYASLLVLLFVMIGFAGWYLLTRRASATPSQPAADTVTAPASVDASAMTPKLLERPVATGAADEEWKRLREKRIAAKPAEAGDVITSLEQAEKNYPRDYRFPYERAKLSIKGITSHHEAFGALAAAAEKAIDNGQSQELLDNLMADKDGDFWKLARGHHEWEALEDALRNKDKAALENLRHH